MASPTYKPLSTIPDPPEVGKLTAAFPTVVPITTDGVNTLEPAATDCSVRVKVILSAKNAEVPAVCVKLAITEVPEVPFLRNN